MNATKSSEQQKAPAYQNHLILVGYLGRGPKVLEVLSEMV
jgi:hypothetical protein